MKNESFVCQVCQRDVTPHPTGSARNHCPHCLSSLHLDAEYPGDRASECGGVMKAMRLIHHTKKGMMIEHICLSCSKINRNIVAPDDEIAPLYSTLNAPIDTLGFSRYGQRK